MAKTYEAGLLISEQLRMLVTGCRKIEEMENFMEMYESDLVLKDFLNGRNKDVFGILTFELEKGPVFYSHGSTRSPGYKSVNRVVPLLKFLERTVQEINIMLAIPTEKSEGSSGTHTQSILFLKENGNVYKN
jgi:hypothetical protein